MLKRGAVWNEHGRHIDLPLIASSLLITRLSARKGQGQTRKLVPYAALPAGMAPFGKIGPPLFVLQVMRHG